MKDSPLPPPVRQLSAKQVRFLFLRHPMDLKPEEQKVLEKILLRHTDLAALYQLVQQFRSLLHARCPEQLDDWVQQVVKTSFSELHHFVSGLRKDWDAVQAAFTVEWSNGMVEGHVNRLKLLKRQMYGRANFDLLYLKEYPHISAVLLFQRECRSNKFGWIWGLHVNPDAVHPLPSSMQRHFPTEGSLYWSYQ